MHPKRWLFSIGLLLLAAPANAQRAKPAFLAQGTCRELPRLNVTFRFGTGSPPAGPPAVGKDGAVYVGTREGYVHALHPDGSYYWSYTVKGPVTGRAEIAGSGAVIVPTTQQIYAIRPDGTLIWSFRGPVRIRGDLIRGLGDRLYFGGEDGRVFSVYNRGAVFGLTRAKVSALPIALSDGAIAAGRADGGVLVSSKRRVERFKLDGPVTAVLSCPGARVCAIAGGVLHALGMPQGGSFVTPAVRARQNGDLLGILSPDQRLEVFRGTSGERIFAVPLPEAASASPVMDGRGTTYVPLRNGALLGFAADGGVTACVAIGSSPLGEPVLDAPRKRLLVTASEGVVASVQLE